VIGILTVQLHLPACSSLKQKRSRIKSLMARLHREFNVSVAEVGMQDRWQEAVISCAMVANQGGYLQSALGTVRHWVTANWPDGMVVDDSIELI
jgi:uncharacterized protein YlxP (DUF503 family)